MPALRLRKDGSDADRCVPDFLRMHELRYQAAAKARRLLCLLFLQLGPLSADSGGTLR